MSVSKQQTSEQNQEQEAKKGQGARTARAGFLVEGRLRVLKPVLRMKRLGKARLFQAGTSTGRNH